MITAWTKHLSTEDEKERFKNQILGSKTVLDRLKDILSEMSIDQDRIERNPEIYNIPNWDYRQAHLNGFKDCLNKLNKILTVE
jgi:hypothetical protein